MKKIKITLIFLIVILILISILFVLYFGENITAKSIDIEQSQRYSYTKAICNENNYCQDYEIICNAGELITKKPITGAAVQFSKSWKDPRDEEMIKKLCEK